MINDCLAADAQPVVTSDGFRRAGFLIVEQNMARPDCLDRFRAGLEKTCRPEPAVEADTVGDERVDIFRDGLAALETKYNENLDTVTSQ